MPSSSSSDLWKDVVPFHRQPQLLNPAAGFVTNANDPPFFATHPLLLPRPQDSPEYYSPQPNIRGGLPEFAMRPKRCYRSMVDALDASRAAGRSGMTLDQMLEASLIADPEINRHLLPDLLSIAGNSSNAWVRQAAQVLGRWSGKHIPEARGALLWGRWVVAYLGTGGMAYRVPFDMGDPLNTPAVGGVCVWVRGCVD